MLNVGQVMFALPTRDTGPWRSRSPACCTTERSGSRTERTGGDTARRRVRTRRGHERRHSWVRSNRSRSRGSGRRGRRCCRPGCRRRSGLTRPRRLAHYNSRWSWPSTRWNRDVDLVGRVDRGDHGTRRDVLARDGVSDVAGTEMCRRRRDDRRRRRGARTAVGDGVVHGPSSDDGRVVEEPRRTGPPHGVDRGAGLRDTRRDGSRRGGRSRVRRFFVAWKTNACGGRGEHRFLVVRGVGRVLEVPAGIFGDVLHHRRTVRVGKERRIETRTSAMNTCRVPDVAAGGSVGSDRTATDLGPVRDRAVPDAAELLQRQGCRRLQTRARPSDGVQGVVVVLEGRAVTGARDGAGRLVRARDVYATMAGVAGRVGVRAGDTLAHPLRPASAPSGAETTPEPLVGP